MRYLILFTLVFQISTTALGNTQCESEIITPSLEGEFLENVSNRLLIGDEIILKMDQEIKIHSGKFSRLSKYRSNPYFAESTYWLKISLLEGQIKEDEHILLKTNQEYRLTVVSTRDGKILIESESGKQYRLGVKAAFVRPRELIYPPSLIRLAKGLYRGVQVARGGYTLNSESLVTVRDDLCDEDYIHSLEVTKKPPQEF